ncbi:hypothetical protein A6F68_01538 [Tsuneonella dongtanensis]|uniref:DoxX n=1 Tax=Tsuneonella dongtanensis TaxID=692370 RepID=A0A1B2AD19_9SPHN|nr:hypothetical protein [Tsuneonella dongtanensis]ANY20052.1 hypothetical protein A6F68_01538 [Tsuneonella dongtanensis]
MDETIETGPMRAGTPWHVWVVGVLALLWNTFGAYDYIMSKTGNRDYLASMMEPVGVTVDDAIAYMNAMPLWANIGWGLGVWGAVAGSLLVLLRSRFAFHAFVVSLIGLVLGTFHQLSSPMPGMTDTTTPMIFTAVIFVITLLLIWYTRRQSANGVLR